MTRTRVRRRRLALTLCVALVGAAWAAPAVEALGPAAEPVPVARTTYLVRDGDTLWSIARRLSPQDDPRALVDAISSANHVAGSRIVPGQMLVVPSAP